MSKFLYTISIGDTNTQTSSISAKTIDEARKILEQSGLKVLSIKKEVSFLEGLINKKSLSTRNLITFFSTIASMDSVGIDLIRSLKLLKDEIATDSQMIHVCTQIYNNVSNGMLFSESCTRASSSFDNQMIALIKIAEKTGKFHVLFTALVKHIKWQEDIKKKSKKAIKGPLMTLCFMLGIVVLLSILAIPKIVEFLKYFNMEPPFSTILLIKFSNFIIHHGAKVGIAIALAISVIKLGGARSEALMLKIDRLKLSMPLFGGILLKIDVNQFISFFVLMYSAGSDIVDILDSVSETVKNRYIARCIINVKNDVENGTTIFAAIDNYKIFPPMFRKMMAVCEVTGNPAHTLIGIKESYDQELNDSIEGVVGSIKPIMTVILGIMLSWIGSAMLGPIYSNIGNIAK